MLKMLGGDVVGMSTVHEVVAARHCDLRSVLLISPKSYPIQRCPSTTKIPLWLKIQPQDPPLGESCG